jgi:hypothetical protein
MLTVRQSASILYTLVPLHNSNCILSMIMKSVSVCVVAFVYTVLHCCSSFCCFITSYATVRYLAHLLCIWKVLDPQLRYLFYHGTRLSVSCWEKFVSFVISRHVPAVQTLWSFLILWWPTFCFVSGNRW